MSILQDLDIDIAGFSETNTAWQHNHLRYDFNSRARKAGNGLSKTSFSSPSQKVDHIPPNETFQAGSTLTTCLGQWTTALYGDDIQDLSGLGRWSGLTIRGKHDNTLSIVTAYRTCSGNRQSAPLGSTYHREAEYFRDRPGICRNPRKRFLTDLGTQISRLRDDGHSILLLMDANGTMEDDQDLTHMLLSNGLNDLHRHDPAPSTYIGAAGRRIDFMLGCNKVLEATTRAGTLSYIEGPQSDHRGLYIDLDSKLLLAHHPQDNAIQPPQGRTLKTSNPENVTKYHSKMDEYYTKHSMHQRITKLYRYHKKLTNAQLRTRLEKWDRDQGRAMRYAEKSLGKTHRQKHYWSPTLRNAGLLCRYWHQRIYGIRHQRDMTSVINRLQTMIQQHEPTYTFPLQHRAVNIQDAHRYWKQSKKELKLCQQNARELRHQSYETLLERYESDPSPDNICKYKIVVNTIRTEKCREMFRQIKLASTSLTEHSGGIKRIQIPRRPSLSNTNQDAPSTIAPDDIYTHLLRHPDGPTEWETILDRNDIERHLLSYNKSSFRAASASPCGHGVIMDALTFSTLNSAGTDLLRGIVPAEWHNDNQLLKEFLLSFSSPPQVLANSAHISTTISEDDVKRGFGQWKEATSTSPSGRHLGHYKAIIQNPVLLECLTKFLSIAVVERGISIRPWQHAINIMLEKDPGRPTINRLRIIHLFEADFNFFLKLIWGSRLVRRAQDYDMINSGQQYGSVPGKTAIELVMLNQLSNDICRTNKTNIIRFENDASACYDRILVHLGIWRRVDAECRTMLFKSMQTHWKA